MSKCDLCGDKSVMLYTVGNAKSSKEREYHLCKECLKIVHDAYVQIK